MKGLVFTLRPRNRYLTKEKEHRSFKSLLILFRRYGSTVYFTSLFAIGMFAGSISARNAGAELLNNLDFLFTTNLESRLAQPVFSTFSASFASGFIFLLYIFLCGLAPWGMVLTPVAALFKGFGTGLSAGYLIITYGFKGVGFYLLVILGGTFISSFALVIESIQAHYFSCKMFRLIFSGDDGVLAVRGLVRKYLFRSLYMLILTACGSLVDMMLWRGFSGLFF